VNPAVLEGCEKHAVRTWPLYGESKVCIYGQWTFGVVCHSLRHLRGIYVE